MVGEQAWWVGRRCCSLQRMPPSSPPASSAEAVQPAAGRQAPLWRPSTMQTKKQKHQKQQYWMGAWNDEPVLPQALLRSSWLVWVFWGGTAPVQCLLPGQGLPPPQTLSGAQCPKDALPWRQLHRVRAHGRDLDNSPVYPRHGYREGAWLGSLAHRGARGFSNHAAPPSSAAGGPA